MISQDNIKRQCNFCIELMNKLKLDINASAIEYSRMKNYTRKRKDIQRIRRELNELSDMLSDY